MPVKNITPADLAAWLGDPARERPRLVDVRETWEYETCRISESSLVPLRELPARVGELESSVPTVVICHHGGRSMRAAMFLERNGFSAVHNLAGGVDAWARTVDPTMPVY